MLTSIFIISSLIQIAVAIYIFRKGRQNLSYLLFFGLSIVTWCWVFLNYLSIIFLESSSLIYIVRLIMFFAVMQTALFYLFANKFPNKAWHKPDRKFINYGFFTLLTALIVISPFMFSSIKIDQGIPHTQIGPGVLVFTAFIVFSIVNAFKSLIRKFRASAGMPRVQLLLLLMAAVLNWIIVPITNFVMTLTLKDLVFVVISPIYGVLFSGIIAYALSRHHLFDFRKVLRDSIIYVDYYLKHRKTRTLQYYELQTLVDRSTSNHVALDFSGVKELDQETVILFKTLQNHMEEQGKNVYFIGYTKKVFKQLQQSLAL